MANVYKQGIGRLAYKLQDGGPPPGANISSILDAQMADKFVGDSPVVEHTPKTNDIEALLRKYVPPHLRESFGRAPAMAEGIATIVGPAADIMDMKHYSGAIMDSLRAGDYSDAFANSLMTGAAFGMAALPGSVGGIDAAAGIFAGKGAKTMDAVAYQQALDMKAAGKSRQEIWDETGWFKGADDKWRFEIDDSGATTLQNSMGEIHKIETRPNILQDALDHKEAYGAYPDLGETPVSVLTAENNRRGGLYGQRISASLELEPYIGIGDMNYVYAGSRTPASTLLHETQHKIQDIEDFARGGDSSRLPLDEYEHLAGEVEARNVQTRMDKTPAERKANPPWETEEFPPEEQIVRIIDAIKGPVKLGMRDGGVVRGPGVYGHGIGKVAYKLQDGGPVVERTPKTGDVDALLRKYAPIGGLGLPGLSSYTGDMVSESYPAFTRGMSAFGASMAPGAGVADYIGQLPDMQGGKYPSFPENIEGGRYLDAGLQTLGVAGDAAYGLGPLGVAAGIVAKTPRAVKAALSAARAARAGDIGSGQHVYHATFTNRIGKIKEQGVSPLGGGTTNWEKAGGGRYQAEPAVYAFDSPEAALRWAKKMTYEFKEPVSIIKAKRSGQWADDPSADPSFHGKPIQSPDSIKPDDIVSVTNLEDLPLPGAVGMDFDSWATKYADEIGASGEPPSLPITPAKENLQTVLDSNFNSGRVVGDEMVPIDSLRGGATASRDVKDLQRVSDLVEEMKGPDGYIERLIVDQDGTVVEGQHRLSALRELGEESVPITRVADNYEGLDLEKVREAIGETGTRNRDQQHYVMQDAAEMLREEGSVKGALDTYGAWNLDIHPAHIAAMESMESQRLPMDTPARMKRAEEMGFDTDEKLYTGFVPYDNIEELAPETWFSDVPEVAGEYASKASNPGEGVIVPAFIRGKQANLEDPNIQSELFKRLRDDIPEGLSWADDAEAIKWAQDLGFDPDTAQEARDMVDWQVLEGHLTGGRLWDAEGLGNRRFEGQVIAEIQDMGFESVRIPDATFGRPNSSVVVFDPANTRSRFAKFDPAKKDLPGLSMRDGGVVRAPGVYQQGIGKVAYKLQDGGEVREVDSLSTAKDNGVMDTIARLLGTNVYEAHQNITPAMASEALLNITPAGTVLDIGYAFGKVPKYDSERSALPSGVMEVDSLRENLDKGNFGLAGLQGLGLLPFIGGAGMVGRTAGIDKAVKKLGVGDTVTHDKFGSGKILSTTENNLTVDFPGKGETLLNKNMVNEADLLSDVVTNPTANTFDTVESMVERLKEAGYEVIDENIRRSSNIAGRSAYLNVLKDRKRLPIRVSDHWSKWNEGLRVDAGDTPESILAKVDEHFAGPLPMDTPALPGRVGGIDELVKSWDAKGIKNSISEHGDTITLSRIEVPKGQRGEGVGTEAMKELTDYADSTGKRIVLTPDTSFGGSSKGRLENFYKRFGFGKNKGRNKDFTTREGMIRNPQEAQPLPMDTASRMKRAEEMGFDTENIIYHGTHPRNKIDAFDDTKIGSANDPGFYGRGHYFAGTKGEAGYYGENVGEYLTNAKLLDLSNTSGDLTSVGHFQDFAPKLDAIGALDTSQRQSLKSLKGLQKHLDDNIEYLPAQNADGSDGWFARVKNPAPGYTDNIEMSTGPRGYPESKEAAKESLKHKLIYEMDSHHPDVFPGASGHHVSLSDYVRTDLGADNLTEAAKKAGYGGIKFGDETVVFDPKNLRDKKATFDPAKKDLPGLSMRDGGVVRDPGVYEQGIGRLAYKLQDGGEVMGSAYGSTPEEISRAKPLSQVALSLSNIFDPRRRPILTPEEVIETPGLRETDDPRIFMDEEGNVVRAPRAFDPETGIRSYFIQDPETGVGTLREVVPPVYGEAEKSFSNTGIARALAGTGEYFGELLNPETRLEALKSAGRLAVGVGESIQNQVDAIGVEGRDPRFSGIDVDGQIIRANPELVAAEVAAGGLGLSKFIPNSTGEGRGVVLGSTVGKPPTKTTGLLSPLLAADKKKLLDIGLTEKQAEIVSGAIAKIKAGATKINKREQALLSRASAAGHQRSRNANVKLHPQIKGAPSHITGPEAHDALLARLAEAINAGAANRRWYPESTNALTESYLGDPEKTRRLLIGAGIASQQTRVGRDLGIAHRAMINEEYFPLGSGKTPPDLTYQDLLGASLTDPWKPGHMYGVVDDKLRRLAAGQPVEPRGGKIGPYTINLLTGGEEPPRWMRDENPWMEQHLDPSGKNQAVADTIMHSLYGYPGSPLASSTRNYITPTLREAAGDSTGPVSQYQAMAWEAQQGRMGGSGGYSLKDATDEMTGNMNVETVFGSNTGIERAWNTNGMSWETKNELDRRIRGAFTDQHGRSKILDMAGLPQVHPSRAIGSFEGQTNPVTSFSPVMPPATRGSYAAMSDGRVLIPRQIGGMEVGVPEFLMPLDDTTARAATMATLLHQKLGFQKAMGWIKPHVAGPDAPIDQSDFFLVDVGRTLSKGETEAIAKLMYPYGQASPIASGQGVSFLNFSDLPGPEFRSKVVAAADEVLGSETYGFIHAPTQRFYNDHDWKGGYDATKMDEAIAKLGPEFSARARDIQQEIAPRYGEQIRLFGEEHGLTVPDELKRTIEGWTVGNGRRTSVSVGQTFPPQLATPPSRMDMPLGGGRYSKPYGIK